MNYELSLEMSCFVAFLSADLRITGGEAPSISLSIADHAYVYQGALDTEAAERAHDLVAAALRTYGQDESWRRGGFDGTSYRGSFHSPVLSLEKFEFWSPEAGTPPHQLACAALQVVPLDHADFWFGYSLERLRADLHI